MDNILVFINLIFEVINRWYMWCIKEYYGVIVVIIVDILYIFNIKCIGS